MNDFIIRIKKISFNQIKNVAHGAIDVLNPKKNVDKISDIIGIYGQNGSGKTTLIDAISIIQTVMSGNPFAKDVSYFIYGHTKNSTLSIDFSLTNGDQTYDTTYSFELIEIEPFKIQMHNEILSYRDVKTHAKLIKIIDTTPSKEDYPFGPRIRYEAFLKGNTENEIELKITKKLSAINGQSFIFNEDSRKIFKKGFNGTPYYPIIEALSNYAQSNLIVISNSHYASMPIYGFSLNRNKLSLKQLPLLFGINEYDESQYNCFLQLYSQINMVLHVLVPDIKLEYKNYGQVVLNNGQLGYQIQLMSKHGDFLVPLQFESEGIKKLISIVNALGAMYNNESVFVVIDDIDSGIYEYLLGELIKLLDDFGKGQLVFTSHNLRPLEVLDYSSIYFTTINPSNKYIHFSYIKNHHNLRDVYLRAINLGGQKESIYQSGSIYDLDRAFRMANRIKG